MQAELVLDARANLGEGPVWDARTSELLWVDIMSGLVHHFDPVTGTDASVDVGQPLGAVVPRAAGGYALAVRDGFAVADTHVDNMRLVAISNRRRIVTIEEGSGQPDGLAVATRPMRRFLARPGVHGLQPNAYAG